MFNPFLLSPDERLTHWRDFRLALPSQPEAEQLRQLAEYWAQCPLHTYSLDIEMPWAWPTPWEMVYRGDFCKNAVTVAMHMTLRLCGWSPDRLVIFLIKDPSIPDVRMVMCVDDTYLLNYAHGVVADYAAHRGRLDILSRYHWDGKCHRQF